MVDPVVVEGPGLEWERFPVWGRRELLRDLVALQDSEPRTCGIMIPSL